MAMAGIAACASARADDFAPLTNAATLARFAPLPALGQPRAAAPFVQLDAMAANEFLYEGFDAAGTCIGECLLVDAETGIVALRAAGPLGRSAEWRVELPWLSQGGGALDSSIETWHGWFGLPNASRERVARDQFRLRYQRGAATPVDVVEPQHGLGDARVALGWQAGDAVMLRAMGSLPTGDADALLGGQGGGAVWADAALPLSGLWEGYLSGGAAYAVPGGALRDRQKRLIPFGGLGLRVALGQSLSLHAQLQVHGALYGDSDLKALSGIGAPLSLGGRWRFSRGFAVDLSVLEDPGVGVSPDFAVQLVLTGG